MLLSLSPEGLDQTVTKHPVFETRKQYLRVKSIIATTCRQSTEYQTGKINELPSKAVVPNVECTSHRGQFEL